MESVVTSHDQYAGHAATKLDEPKPALRRRFLLELKLGADDRESLISQMDEIARELRRGHLWGNSCSGGFSSGWACEVTEDKTVTHDSYFEAIKNI